jgi:MerR HTH family regulatory protein
MRGFRGKGLASDVDEAMHGATVGATGGETVFAPRREVGYGPSVGTVTQMPPRGRYLAQEVDRLSGVSGGTIGQWLHHGYIRASQSESKDYPRVYSFQDAAEAILVHELLDEGVPTGGAPPSYRESAGDTRRLAFAGKSARVDLR